MYICFWMGICTAKLVIFVFIDLVRPKSLIHSLKVKDLMTVWFVFLCSFAEQMHIAKPNFPSVVSQVHISSYNKAPEYLHHMSLDVDSISMPYCLPIHRCLGKLLSSPHFCCGDEILAAQECRGWGWTDN